MKGRVASRPEVLRKYGKRRRKKKRVGECKKETIQSVDNKEKKGKVINKRKNTKKEEKEEACTFR